MVTNDLVRQHLRIDDDEFEEQYIQHLIDVATTYVTSLTGIQNNNCSSPVYEHAVLLLIGHLHQNRESVSEVNLSEVPMGFKMLLTTLRNIGPGIGGEDLPTPADCDVPDGFSILVGKS